MIFSFIQCGDYEYHGIFPPVISPSTASSNGENPAIMTWENLLTDYKLNIEDNPFIFKELFYYAKDEFESFTGGKIDASYISIHTTNCNNTYVPFRNASRLFTTKSVVCVDEIVFYLITDCLFAGYIWARDGKEHPDFPFPYLCKIINLTFHTGATLDQKSGVDMLNNFSKDCSPHSIMLVSDLVCACTFFSFLHELAHIYLKHPGKSCSDNNKNYQMEYDADELAYLVFLNVIQEKGTVNSSFSDSIHSYLWGAPMILFSIFDIIYFFDFWAFGNKIGSSHPAPIDRLNHLISIVEEGSYTFPTEEGNALICNYMDVGDWFKEELIYKLIHGKLHNLIIHGDYYNMGDNNFEEALKYYKSLEDTATYLASITGVPVSSISNLIDSIIIVSPKDDSGRTDLIYSKVNRTTKAAPYYSTKPYNVFFSLKKLFALFFDLNLTLADLDSPLSIIKSALMLLCKLYEITTIEITDEQANMLIACYNLHADIKDIPEEDLLLACNGTHSTVDTLVHLRCITLENGQIKLAEKILIS